MNLKRSVKPTSNENLVYLGDTAEFTFVFGFIASPAQRVFDDGLSAVDGSVGSGANVKGIVRTVVELLVICWISFTGLRED